MTVIQEVPRSPSENLALKYLRMGQLEEAWQAASQELEKLPRGTEVDRYFQLSFVLSEVLRIRGQSDAALKFLDSLKLEEPSNPKCDIALSMHRGYCKALLGDYAAAKSLLQDAESAALQAELYELHAEIVVRRAMVAYLETDFLMAGTLYGSVVDKYGERFGWYLYCVATSGVGKSLMARGLFEEAIPLFNRAIELAKGADAKQMIAQNWSELGVCYLGLHQAEKALEVHFEADRALFAIGAMHAYQVNLADIGNVYLYKKEYLTAISYYQRALDLAREMKATASIEKWTFNLRLAYSRLKHSMESAPEED